MSPYLQPRTRERKRLTNDVGYFYKGGLATYLMKKEGVLFIETGRYQQRLCGKNGFVHYASILKVHALTKKC